ncbi:SDR family NAD(P)-dependent oxidoreductase [Paractinoplanes durhamensis]|uniref:SDR family NAD(P)-dependent oxidoreductase n=1 Tax=Paractinoplanes durhamensis TaxID=113563 RepID=UPI00363977E4
MGTNSEDQGLRTAVITGATSGLGLVVARELAGAGVRVVIGARNTRKADAVIAELPGAGHTAYTLDLADLDSVREFAAAVRGSNARIDLLVNNAGIMAVPRTLSAQGYELQFAVNHLGHFALTAGLLDLIAGRIVTVTSVLHRKGRLDLEDPAAERGYSANAAYNRSKLANAIFALELHRRLAAAGSQVRSIAAHPGYAVTNLQASVPPGLYRFLLTKLGNPLIAVPASKGAVPLLFAATSPDARSGELIGPGGPGRCVALRHR